MTGQAIVVGVLAASLTLAACTSPLPEGTYATPEEAAQSLMATVEAGDLDALVRLLGAEGPDLVASSDPATGRRNREIFRAAAREQWRLEERGADARELIVGNEDWPFPIPIVKGERGWRFDAAAGMEEVVARRIGRNELAAIDTCRAYASAQQAYARTGHDGKPAGLFARRFASEPGRQNGLYWPVTRGQPRSPLGDLVAAASTDGYDLGARQSPAPFHGYVFRILTAQGPSAPGGARDYLRNSEMTGGFALVASPAQYDATGVMTFIIGPDGVVHEKDLGSETPAIVAAMTAYDPGEGWRPVQSAPVGGR